MLFRGRVKAKAQPERKSFFRWRGRLNWKDITERIISGIISGLAAGVGFWAMVRLLGG